MSASFKSFLFLLVLTSTLLAQGKILTNNEALEKFGPVLNSVSISVVELDSILVYTNSFVMFRILENKLYILGDGRKVLYPSGGKVDSGTVFIRYSKEKVTELLNIKQSQNIFIEKREDVLTISGENYSLEFGQGCPPFCN